MTKHHQLLKGERLLATDESADPERSETARNYKLNGITAWGWWIQNIMLSDISILIMTKVIVLLVEGHLSFD